MLCEGLAPNAMKAVPSEVAPQDAEGHLWDVIVIGTGAGGSTAGFNLARLGRSVLFVERGKLLHHDPASCEAFRFHGQATPKRRSTMGGGPALSIIAKKKTALQFLRGRPLVPAQVDRRRSLMHSWTDFVRKISHRVVFFRAYLIRLCPKHGQSAMRKWRRSTSGQRACIVYEARKTHSRQRESASSSHRRRPTREVAVFDAVKGVGLHPYRIHSALERVPGCAECPGMLCPRACRNDAARICLYPALDRYGAKSFRTVAQSDLKREAGLSRG